MPISPGIAAGHPATADAGVEALEAGGTAADAAVAASLASCAAEVVMTGLAGGGFALWWDAETEITSVLDFFVAVPGLGRERRHVELTRLEVPFGTELVHYAVGIGSCAVPGVPAGLDELWRRYGRLPWAQLCEPAVRIAREGVEMPPAHAACLAMLAPVMTMREGERIFAPGGRLLETGDPLRQPGLARAFEVVAEEGARSFYDGTLARLLLELMDERGGLVTADDLEAYRPAWQAPIEFSYAGRRVLTRPSLAPLGPPLAALPRLEGLPEAERALALARALDGRDRGGDTTNLVAVDEDGNACVVTTSLGLGSGDFLPGLEVHLNSMLGEADLLTGRLEPGERMGSMMSPCAVLEGPQLALAGGAAGGTRLRSALVQVLAGILDEGLDPQEAVDRPRLHPAGGVINLEPGFGPGVAPALESLAEVVRVWPARHHYFGGVSVVSRRGAAADPRRSGAVRKPA